MRRMWTFFLACLTVLVARAPGADGRTFSARGAAELVEVRAAAARAGPGGRRLRLSLLVELKQGFGPHEALFTRSEVRVRPPEGWSVEPESRPVVWEPARARGAPRPSHRAGVVFNLTPPEREGEAGAVKLKLLLRVFASRPPGGGGEGAPPEVVLEECELELTVPVDALAEAGTAEVSKPETGSHEGSEGPRGPGPVLFSILVGMGAAAFLGTVALRYFRRGPLGRRRRP